jgi:hypothetical protein
MRLCTDPACWCGWLSRCLTEKASEGGFGAAPGLSPQNSASSMAANLSPLGARSHSRVCLHVSRPPAWPTQDASESVWQRAGDASEGRGVPFMVMEGIHCTSVVATNVSHVACGASESSNQDKFEDRLTNPEPRARGSPSYSRFWSFIVHLGALATGAWRGASSALGNAKCDHDPAQGGDTRSPGGTAIKETSGTVPDGVGVVAVLPQGGAGGRTGVANRGCKRERATCSAHWSLMRCLCSNPAVCINRPCVHLSCSI